MKKLVLPLSILAMVLLLAAAFAWDSVRAATNARERVSLADGEMRKQEERLLKLLTDSSKKSPEVESAIASYKSAVAPADRQAAYDAIVANFQKTMSAQIDPTNPLERKFMDNIAGAINRREIAQKQYDEEAAAYKAYMAGFRGKIAGVFEASSPEDTPGPQTGAFR